MPLPTGTWNINADGNQGGPQAVPPTAGLVIGTLGAPDSSGNVFFQGSLTVTTPGGASTQQITGFWDEAGQEISFLALLSGSPYPYPAFADFRGKLYSFPPQTVGTQDVTTYTLAGVERLYSMTDNAVAWNTLISGRPGLWCAQESKEGKDGKDKEVSKDDKDLKDRKEGGKDIKDKEPADVKDPPREMSPLNPMGSTLMADQLALRVSALEQQMAIGRSFIAPEERPAIGGGVSTGRA
jgi:hypothetical protein